jgi:hypothetical protein
MKNILKEINEQLSEAIHLAYGYKVSALIDDKQDDKIVGWTIVQIFDDGNIKPVGRKYNNLRELIKSYMD